MSKRNFFSLINGDNIQLAPATKVIKAKSFSTLLDAKALKNKTLEDALLYKKQIVQECEQLKEAAEKAGFEKGLAAWTSHIASLEQKIASVQEEISHVIVPVALKAAKKIVGKELEMNKDAILDIVSNCLKSVAQHKKITIYVSKNDLATLTKNRDKIKNLFEGLESLSLRERDDITPGGCVIETEGGIINAKLENQWAILEHAFASLLKGK